MFFKKYLVRFSQLLLLFTIYLLGNLEQTYLALDRNPVFTEINKIYSSNLLGAPVYDFSENLNTEPFSGLRSMTRFFTEFAYYNNSDYREYKNRSSTQIQRTDDLQYFATSFLHIDLYAKPNLNTYFQSSLSTIIFFGATDYKSPSETSMILFEELFVNYRATPNFSWLIGRFHFQIHENGTNYLFYDYCNGVSLILYPLPDLRLRLLVFDVLAADKAYGQAPLYLSRVPSSTIPANFNGDTKAIRTGAVFDSPPIKLGGKVPWYISAFLFFVKYGGVEGGTERSGLGAYGNLTDGDYLLFYGTHQKVVLGDFTLITEAAGSTGLDRKIYGFGGFKKDVYANGFFVMLNVSSPLYFKTVPRSAWSLSFVYTSGADIDRYGRKKSYGFASTSGEPIGGILTGRFKGYNAGTIAGREGFHHNPYEPDRASGLYYLKQHFEMEWKNTLVDWSNHYFIDATESFHSMDKKYNYNKTIGFESNLKILVALNKNLSISLVSGIFLPGKFLRYKRYTHLPAGKNSFYGFSFGTYLRF